METEPAKSVADLVDEAAEAVDADADEGWEGVGPEAEGEGDNEWEAVLKEVVDASVGAVVESEVTIFVEDDSAALLGVLGGQSEDELVGAEVSSTHDLLLVVDWEEVEEDDGVSEHDACDVGVHEVRIDGSEGGDLGVVGGGASPLVDGPCDATTNGGENQVEDDAGSNGTFGVLGLLFLVELGKTCFLINV